MKKKGESYPIPFETDNGTLHLYALRDFINIMERNETKEVKLATNLKEKHKK